MNKEEKIGMLKTLLGIDDLDGSEYNLITTYLTAAEKEIISWRYSLSSMKVDTVPTEYEMTQIFAVIAGYSQGGAENQTSHTENSITRQFKYEDMIAYIRSHVTPLVGIL